MTPPYHQLLSASRSTPVPKWGGWWKSKPFGFVATRLGLDQKQLPRTRFGSLNTLRLQQMLYADLGASVIPSRPTGRMELLRRHGLPAPLSRTATPRQPGREYMRLWAYACGLSPHEAYPNYFAPDGSETPGPLGGKPLAAPAVECAPVTLNQSPWWVWVRATLNLAGHAARKITK